MATRSELMALGMAGPLAAEIGSSKATALKALGSTKATALVLAATVAIFGTVSSGTGAMLPAAAGSPPVSIYNGGSNALLIYTANTLDTINALSAGAGFSVTNGKSAIFWPAGNIWTANLSA
jgi:hypothetical protein